MSGSSSSNDIIETIADKLDSLASQIFGDNAPPSVSTDNNQPEVPNSIDQTLSGVQVLANDIDRVKQYTNQIAENHKKMISSFTNEDVAKETKLLHTKVKELSHEITDELKNMNEMLKQVEPGARHTADYRIKKAQYSALSRKFHNIIMEYNKEEDKYAEMKEDKIKRNLKIAGKLVTDESLLQDTQQFTQNIFKTSLPREQQEALKMAEAEKEEVIKLEESIKELNNLFYDLYQIVDDQGDLVDQVEQNVQEAKNYVVEGTTEVQNAVVYAQKNRKLQICICVVITLIIAVVVVITIATVTGVYFKHYRV